MGILDKARQIASAAVSDDAPGDISKMAWPRISTHIWIRLDCCTAAHPSRVEDIDDHNNLMIGGPMPIHHPPVNAPKETFRIAWQSHKGNCNIEVELVEESQAPVFMWKVRAVSEPEIVQRRNYFRVETDIPVCIKYPGNLRIEAKSKNISEGGMSCLIPAQVVNPGERPFELVLGIDGQTYSCKAEIVRWGNPEDSRLREIGIQFLNNPPGLRDAARRHVYQQQIAMRQRGAL